MDYENYARVRCSQCTDPVSLHVHVTLLQLPRGISCRAKKMASSE
jgi:hypothetical protein